MSDEKHFRSSEKVRDFVIGMSDGLTVPFALAAGLSAVATPSLVITARAGGNCSRIHCHGIGWLPCRAHRD